MKHTECKDCELSSGDCGYYFKIDGKVNYDIVALTACDKYGNCEFFKPKAKPQGDTISRKALKKAIYAEFGNSNLTDAFNDIIDNVPAVELDEMTQDLIDKVNVNVGLAQPIKDDRPQGKWIVKSNGNTNYYACDKCGSAGDIQDKFCRECGAAMRGEK